MFIEIDKKIKVNINKDINYCLFLIIPLVVISAILTPSGGINVVVVVIPFFREVLTRNLSKSISCSDKTLCGFAVGNTGTGAGCIGECGVAGVAMRRDISKMPEV